MVMLKRRKIVVSSGEVKNKRSLVFLYLLFLMILFLWLFELAKPALQISISVLPETITKFLTHSFFLKIAGISMIILALLFLLISLIHFKNSLRFGLDESNLGKLITCGIFAISRNPFFLSLDLYFLGIALLLPSFFFIGFSVLTFIGIHFFILKEEKFMLKNYDGEYENYQTKVRRYF
jgi:protein-S-isoprenylcysteine O-methyltransferase Ste14